MFLDLTTIIALMLICGAIFFLLHGAERHDKYIQSEEERIAEAAAREFEGAKPALIHACDTTIDALPDNVDISSLEAKGLITLTTLMQRLLTANPLLAGADLLLMSLLPTAFAAIPKTVELAAYKGLLKEEVVKVIRGARL